MSISTKGTSEGLSGEEADNTVGCGLWLVFLVPLLVLRGFVLQRLWGWFLTPVIGVDSPSIAVCLGLTGLVGVFTYNPHKETLKSELLPAFGRSIFSLTFSLLFGWLLHLCVEAGW